MKAEGYLSILFEILSGEDFATYGDPKNGYEETWLAIQKSIENHYSPYQFYTFYSFDPKNSFRLYGSKNVKSYISNFSDVEMDNQLDIIKSIHKDQIINFLALAITGVYFVNNDIRLMTKVGINKEVSYYQVSIPMKLKNEQNYSLVEQITEPHVFDCDDRVVGVLNRYRVISVYDYEPLRPCFAIRNSLNVDGIKFSREFSEKYNYFLQKIYNIIGGQSPFTKRQLEILFLYGNVFKKKGKVENIEMAKRLNIKSDTVDDHYANIIKNTESNFSFKAYGNRSSKMQMVYKYLVDCSFLPGRNLFVKI